MSAYPGFVSNITPTPRVKPPTFRSGGVIRSPVLDRAVSCPDGCTRIEAGSTALGAGGRGACGQPLGPASTTGTSA